MEQQKEIDLLDKQILNIKNNSEYQRLLTSARGIRDDQRFKAYTLQLQTLTLKKGKILAMKNSQSNNARLTRSLTKPLAQKGDPAPKKEEGVEVKPEAPKAAPGTLKKAVAQSFTKQSAPRGKLKVNMGLNLKVKSSRSPVPTPVQTKPPSTASRTIKRVSEPTPKRFEGESAKTTPVKRSVVKPALKASTPSRSLQKAKGAKGDKAEKVDKVDNIDDLDIDNMEDLLNEVVN